MKVAYRNIQQSCYSILFYAYEIFLYFPSREEIRALLPLLFTSQAKADEIARLMNENEQLKTVIDELKVSGCSFLLACFQFTHIAVAFLSSPFGFRTKL